jgi:hypothetical protein
VNEHAGRANLKRFTNEEMAEFDVLCASAERAIGRTISNDKFGEWPAITGTHPNFAEIEKNVGMDHWRPRYKWASTHTHANHKPIGTLLGMAESTTFVNLVGASNSGFVDPFLMTSITLSQITTTFLLIAPNPDRLVHANVMLRLADEMQTIAVETEKLTRGAFNAVKPSRPSAPSFAASMSK